jgi:hypothetical protein
MRGDLGLQKITQTFTNSVWPVLFPILILFSISHISAFHMAYFLDIPQVECHQCALTFVSEQIKRLRQTSSTEHDISIFWVPRRTLVSNKILEDSGITGDVNIAELSIYFLPLEKDLLSLELPDAFSDLYLVRRGSLNLVSSHINKSSA